MASQQNLTTLQILLIFLLNNQNLGIENQKNVSEIYFSEKKIKKVSKTF